MTSFVALLRAVNVGGNNKIAMPVLREMFEASGYTNVTTFIQSGNVVFDGAGTKGAALVRDIETSITRTFGLRIDVVVRSARELADAIKANPFADRVHDPATLHIAFLNDAPDRARLETLDRARFEPDEFAIGRREVYLHCPNGVGRSKLPTALASKLAPATMRNWNTVTKLAELAAR